MLARVRYCLPALAELPPIDLSGTTLGEYEVLRRIGVGGMGVVYAGRHPVIGKKVAVKVLTEEASKQAEAVDRFLDEARAVNAIRHRGIVDIFGFGRVPGGAQYFVMELLEGSPFDEVIRQRAPVSPGEALRWIDEVLDALDAAHHAGVIHRDIKPSNLFLVDSGRGTPYVKLLDFGIAKLGAARGQNTPQTNVNAVVGTPDYMAPEQARGQAISGLTDLYALGCVLYELLTGQRIFVAESTLEIMFAHVERAPVPPSKVVPSIPEAVDKFLLHLVKKNPAKRPQNAHLAREELHAVLREIGEAGSLPAPSDRSLQPTRGVPITASSPATVLVKPPKNPVVPAAIAGALMLVSALAFAFWPHAEPVAPAPIIPSKIAPERPPPPPTPPPEVEAQLAEAPPPPPAVVDAGVPVVMKPRKDALPARLAKLKLQLEEHDKQIGERDRILHRLLEAAEKDLLIAKTPEQKKAVAAQFDDLQAQLKQ